MIREPKRKSIEERQDASALLRPQGLASGPAQLWVGLVAVLTLIALYWLEVATPKDFSVTALSIFPVLAVSWLCGPRITIFVVVLSMLSHIGLVFSNEISSARASVHISADATIAIIGRLASVSLATVRTSRERELSVLLGIAKGLGSSDEPSAVVAQVANAAAAFVSEQAGGPGRAGVFRLEGGEAVVIAEQDAVGHSLLHQRFELSPDFLDVLRGSRASVVSLEVMSPAMREAMEGAEVAAAAIAPIRTGGELTGFLSAALRSDERFTSAALRILEGIADLAGISLESAERLQAERRRVLTFQTLHEVATAVAAAASPRDVASLVVNKTADLVGGETAVLAWQERKGDLLRVLASLPAGIAAAFPPREGVMGQAFTEGRPFRAYGADQLSAGSDQLIAGANPSLLAVPLLVQGETVGALAVASPRPFLEEDVLTVSVVASQVAPLINQAQLRSGLDESAQRFRDLYHALGCGVIVHNAGGEFVDANWAAENLLGVGHDVLSQDAFGAGWSIRLPNGGDLLGPLRPPTAVSLYGRPIQGLVAEVAAPGGSPRWLRIDSSLVGASSGTRWVVTSFFEVPAPAKGGSGGGVQAVS